MYSLSAVVIHTKDHISLSMVEIFTRLCSGSRVAYQNLVAHNIKREAEASRFCALLGQFIAFGDAPLTKLN